LRYVNRYVKKGAKAFYILAPCIYKKKADDEEKEFLTGFKCIPTFRYEDTEGEELDYRQIELPELPLVERAEEWGISIKAIPGNYKHYGYYSSGRREIAIDTREECVFFHELAHCGHDKAKGGIKGGQDPLQEIIAELSAQALCKIVGKQTTNTLGNSYQYIDRYARKINLSPLTGLYQSFKRRRPGIKSNFRKRGWKPCGMNKPKKNFTRYPGITELKAARSRTSSYKGTTSTTAESKSRFCCFSLLDPPCFLMISVLP